MNKKSSAKSGGKAKTLKEPFKRTAVPSKKELVKAATALTSEIEALGVNGLPLRPYLDDIWAAINGSSTDISGIQTAIIAIQADIATIQATCCGSDVFGDLDGGAPNSIYLIDQNVDGGGP